MRNHLRSCISTQNGRRRTRNNQNHTSFLSVIKTKLSCPSNEGSLQNRKDACLLSKNVSTRNLLPSAKERKVDLTEILRRAEKVDPEILKNSILNRLLGLDQRRVNEATFVTTETYAVTNPEDKPECQSIFNESPVKSVKRRPCKRVSLCQ